MVWVWFYTHYMYWVRVWVCVLSTVGIVLVAMFMRDRLVLPLKLINGLFWKSSISPENLPVFRSWCLYSSTLILYIPVLCAHKISGEQGLRNRCPPPFSSIQVKAGGQIFRERSSTHDFSLPPVHRRWHLNPVLVLMWSPRGCSRDGTANHLMHRLWSRTSSRALCWLMWTTPPVPSALAPHQDELVFLF